MTSETVKRYPNPAHGPSAFLQLTDDQARAAGLNPADGIVREEARPGPAPVDLTNEGGAPLVSSATAATSSASTEEDKPEGALEPGGPTARARRAAAAEAPQEPGPAALEGTDPEGAAVEPGEGDEGEDGEPKTSRRRRASGS